MFRWESSQIPLEQIVKNNPYYRDFSCDSKQWDDVSRHNLRVGFIAGSMIVSKRSKEIFPLGLPQKSALSEIFLGTNHHDIGYSVIENHIHLAISSRQGAKEHDHYIKTHPSRGIDLLGEKFIEEHQLAAAIILHHNLETPQHPHPAINPQVLETEAFKFGLALIRVSDGITAGNEIFRYYNHGTASPQDKTISILTEVLNQHGLAEWINIPAAVSVGYKAFKRLTPSRYPGFAYLGPNQQSQALPK